MPGTRSALRDTAPPAPGGALAGVAGHTVLPDHVRLLERGSSRLRVTPARDLVGALDALSRMYHVLLGTRPAGADRALWLGPLDTLLLPYADGVDEDRITEAVGDLLATLDRAHPGSAPWIDLGPEDTRVARAVLRAVRGSSSAVVTLHLDAHPVDRLVRQAVRWAGEVGPGRASLHLVGREPVLAALGRPFGVAPGHLHLPVGGGVAAEARVDLAAAALAHTGTPEDFVERALPAVLIPALAALRPASDGSAGSAGTGAAAVPGWLVREGLVDPAALVGVLTVTGLAEAVDHLLGAGMRYGLDAEAAGFAGTLSSRLARLVRSATGSDPRSCPPVLAHLPCPEGGPTGPDGTPAADRPPPYNHLRTLAVVQPGFPGGGADVLFLDAGVAQNPTAGTDLVRGALAVGITGLALSVCREAEVRVTGFLVRHGVVVKPDSPRWGPR